MTDQLPITADDTSVADADRSPLGALGRRRFIAGATAAAGAAALASTLPAGVAHALPAGSSRYVPLPKGERLADTRRPAEHPYTDLGNNTIRVKVTERFGVPADATGVVLTLAAVNFGERTHCTVFPSGEAQTITANLNLEPWAINANLVTAKLGAGGSVDVYSLRPCHKIVDVVGYYVPVSGKVSGGRFISLDSPRRVFDSRPGLVPNESFTLIDVTDATPSDAGSVVINLAAAGCTAAGHFTALSGSYDETKEVTTSSLNASGPGDTRSAGAIVPVFTYNGRRYIKIYAHRSAFVIVDVFGHYTSDKSTASDVGLFVPVTPQRVLDTRRPGQIGRMWPRWVVEVPLPAAYQPSASAVAVNVTEVASRAAGHLTVSAARRPIPNTANVNWTVPNATVPNHVMTTVTNSYGLQVFSLTGGHVVVDMNGYFTGSPQLQQVRYVNPPPPSSPPYWNLQLPRIGLNSTVMAGDPHAVTDAGHSWLWTGTGYLGQEAHVAVFGHRTEAGGPYRNIQLVQPGDLMYLRTGDGRLYTYRMVRRDLVTGASKAGPPIENILAATRYHPGTTFSLIACTRTDLLPTSLNHRLVVTFELVCDTPYCFTEF